MKLIRLLNQFKNHQGAMKYLKNTSWLLAEKILRLTVGLFVGVWVARYLGPENFGLFSYSQSFVALFSTIAVLGLDGIVIRELVKDITKRDKILGTVFILKLIGAILALLFIAIVIFFQSNDLQTTTVIFLIASATILQSFNAIDFYFQSQVLSKFVVYCNAFTLLTSSIIKVILILNEAPLIAFAYMTIFDSFILSSGLVYFYFKHKLSVMAWKFDLKLAIELLKSSWPFMLSSVIVTIYMKIDQVMIGEMLGNTAVGQYAAAARLSEIWYFIPMVIVSSLFPSLIQAKNKSKKLYHKRFQSLNDLVIWLAIPVAIITTYLGEWIVNILYGDQYAEAASVLVIHIWSSIFVSMAVVSGKILIADNLGKKALFRNILGLIVNLLLNVILIPKYGIQGAAIATLVSWFVVGACYDIFDKDLRYMFLIKCNSFNVYRLITNSYSSGKQKYK
ncbi:MAG: flippase [Colwellia sp.]|nr:flippase [Colwellia sp.]